MRAIEAASDTLFVAEGAEAVDDGVPAPDPGQRRADAVGLIAERALSAGFGHARRRGSEALPGGVSEDAPISGSRAERYQVMLYVDVDTLREEGDPGRSELEDGTRVSAETARRIACDAGRVDVHGRADLNGRVDVNRRVDVSARVEGAGDASSLSVGRRRRTIPPAIRRALEVRDRGCRFPGCGLRLTDAHHIVHWADGGETSLNNLVLLCRRHHRRVHEEGHRVCSDRVGNVVFYAPSGKVLFAAPPPPELEPDPVARLVRGNRERGIEPDWASGRPRWRYDRDIPWGVEAAAMEALDPRVGSMEPGDGSLDQRGEALGAA